MILCNNLTRLVAVPIGTGAKFVDLIPGNNSVPDAIFKEIEKHPSVKQKLADGSFTIGHAKPVSSSPKGGVKKDPETEKAPLADLKDMSQKDAIATIEATFNLDTLKEWRKDAKGKIKSAIVAQIKEIEKKG